MALTMKIPPPPYRKRHRKTSAEFVVELPPEKLTEFIDARDQEAEHLPAIRQRFDALYDALDDGWCAPRVIENQLGHLHRALSSYHFSRYLTETLRTLQEAEADLAIWQRMTPT